MHDWNEDCPPPSADEEKESVDVQVERAIRRARQKRFEIPCKKDDDPDKLYGLV